MDKLLLRVAEAAELTSISRTKAYDLIASGEWPIVKIGRATRIPLAELQAWVERQKQVGLEEGSQWGAMGVNATRLQRP